MTTYSSAWANRTAPQTRDAVRRVTIGRAEDCEISVADPYLGLHHALAWTDRTGQAWVMDLGSTNGTYILRAGLRIRVYGPTPIYPGDVLAVGNTSIPWTPS